MASYLVSPKSAYKITHPELTTGGQASIYKVCDTRSNENMALKIYSNIDQKEKNNISFINEKKALQILADTPGIINIKDEWQTYTRGYLVTELCECDIDPYIYGTLDIQEVKKISLQILRGLEYSHKKGIQHNDVKPCNILRKSKNYFLCDFGLCIHKDDKVNRVFYPGTTDYVCPEIIANKMDVQNNFGKCDVWSMGITMYELLTGTTPFYCDSIDDTLIKIQRSPPIIGAQINHSFKDLIFQTLEKNPSDRPSVSEILQHHFWD